MGERKVLNKYFPPDFDPAALPKRKRAQTNDMKVRMMLPMSVRCKTCGTYMYKGTKFNTRKEDVLGESYLGIQIYRFYYRCTVCAAEFTMKTDPKTSDYVLEEGANRNYEHWREEERDKAEIAKEREQEEMGNAMKALENRTLESKREMDIMAALDEMRALKGLQSKVTTADALAALQREADKRSAADGSAAAAMGDVSEDLEEFYRLRRAAVATQKLHGASSEDDEGDDQPGPSKRRTGAGVGSIASGTRRTAGAGLSLAAAAMDEELAVDTEGDAGTGVGASGNGTEPKELDGDRQGNGRVGNGAGSHAEGVTTGDGRQRSAEGGIGGAGDPLASALAGVKSSGAKEGDGTGKPTAGGAPAKATAARPLVKVVAKPKLAAASNKGAGSKEATWQGLGAEYEDGSGEEKQEGTEGAGLGGLLGGYGSSSQDTQ